MAEERYWLVVVNRERYEGERLYAYDSLALPGLDGAAGPDDRVVLVAAGEPAVLFGLGRVRPGHPDADLAVRYTHRLFDEPCSLPWQPAPGLSALTRSEYDALAAMVGSAGRTDGRREWFVSVALPIEAVSRAEAVREFWTYVEKLGPQQLPAYVWPQGDELALEAYLQGEPAPQDPEEDG